MRRVIIESPFKRNERYTEKEHVAYAQRCMFDCLKRGEAPIASHLLYPQVLDDTVPEERTLGIEAGLAWHAVADAIVVYEDLGISMGMQAAIERARNAKLTIEYRSLVKAKA